MSRKQKRKRQEGSVSGCPKFVLWMRQLKKGATKGHIKIQPENALFLRPKKDLPRSCAQPQILSGI